MDISIVVPVYGCPSAIPELHRRLVETLESMEIAFEIILVDDCDELGSWENIKKVAKEDVRVKALHLTRNSGQGRAISAGIDTARGEWIVTMDCDLQDAPEYIPLLYNRVIKGYDIVFVRRQERKDSFIVQQLSKSFHRLFSYLSGLSFDYELGTYLIASKRAADQFRKARDRGRDFTMFLMWTGYKADYVELEHDFRYEGGSSYTFKKKWDYAIGVLTTFSNRVLYMPIRVGLCCSILSLVYFFYILLSYFYSDSNPLGWTTIAAAIFMFGGLILSTLGVIGVYIGNIFDMAKDRPLYLIQEAINVDGKKS